MPELLRLEQVWAGYGDAVILEDLSFTLDAGDSLALLGRNGMGKTTLLATLMGAARLRRGKIFYDGADIAHMPSHRRARAGFGWVPQERDIFRSLTVEENLSVVAQPGEWNLDRVYQLFPRLRARRGNLGNQLSGGEQHMLAMRRALILNPKVLLLDEPLEGLAPIIAQELLHIIDQMVKQGSLAVILVEQHARQILPITRQALVLERGRVVYCGSSAELLRNRAALDAWLGAGATTDGADDAAAASRPAPTAERIPAIDAIRNEHRAIAAILNGLTHILDGIGAGRLQPDFTLLASLIEYIAEMPDKVHHPKEDLVFALLRTKTHDEDQHLDRLEADHRDAVRATGMLDRALVHYMQAGAAGFSGFRDAVHAYIRDEWVHLNTEERCILPAAQRLFSADEWSAFNDDFARNGDPWSGEGNRFARLFKQIANLAPAPIGVGGPH